MVVKWYNVQVTRLTKTNKQTNKKTDSFKKIVLQSSFDDSKAKTGIQLAAVWRRPKW